MGTPSAIFLGPPLGGVDVDHGGGRHGSDGGRRRPVSTPVGCNAQRQWGVLRAEGCAVVPQA